MPPRTKFKAKAVPKDTPETATPEVETPGTTSKKRKVDWSTIDDEKPFQGFKLEAVRTKTPKKSSPANKRQKTSQSSNGSVESYKNAPLDADIVQKNPFPDSELSETHYKVKPSMEWESTHRYRRFTITEAEFEVGQIIFVKVTEDAYDPTDPSHNAFGKVLEVRAGDAAHVFLRVYWLYKPEELPDGRQPYHGDSELIASNHMDIIEALTVVDRADVVHWDEDPDNSEWPMKDQLFWRQTYDIEKPKSQQLSKLRPFCIDKAPCNPDEPLINCASCSGWLHARCLEAQAVDDAHIEKKVPVKGQSAKTKKKGRRKSLVEAAFTARLTTQDSNQICLTVTDQRPGEDGNRWNVDVKCLMCKTLIEKAARDIPEVPTVDAVTATLTVAVTSDPDEEDSVFGKDDDTEMQSDPLTNDTATTEPAPRVVPNARGRPRKRKRSVTEPSIDQVTPVTTALVPESLYQSGIRSVKRLLWSKI